jgi:hypothetical protein
MPQIRCETTWRPGHRLWFQSGTGPQPKPGHFPPFRASSDATHPFQFAWNHPQSDRPWIPTRHWPSSPTDHLSKSLVSPHPHPILRGPGTTHPLAHRDRGDRLRLRPVGDRQRVDPVGGDAIVGTGIQGGNRASVFPQVPSPVVKSKAPSCGDALQSTRYRHRRPDHRTLEPSTIVHDVEFMAGPPAHNRGWSLGRRPPFGLVPGPEIRPARQGP